MLELTALVVDIFNLYIHQLEVNGQNSLKFGTKCTSSWRDKTKFENIFNLYVQLPEIYEKKTV